MPWLALREPQDARALPALLCVCEYALCARWKSVSCEVTIICSRRQLRRCEAGWEAAGGERAARRMTNPIRRRGSGELAGVRAKPGPVRLDRTHEVTGT